MTEATMPGTHTAPKTITAAELATAIVKVFTTRHPCDNAHAAFGDYAISVTGIQDPAIKVWRSAPGFHTIRYHVTGDTIIAAAASIAVEIFAKTPACDTYTEYDAH